MFIKELLCESPSAFLSTTLFDSQLTESPSRRQPVDDRSYFRSDEGIGILTDYFRLFMSQDIDAFSGYIINLPIPTGFAPDSGSHVGDSQALAAMLSIAAEIKDEFWTDEKPVLIAAVLDLRTVLSSHTPFVDAEAKILSLATSLKLSSIDYAKVLFHENSKLLTTTVNFFRQLYLPCAVFKCMHPHEAQLNCHAINSDIAQISIQTQHFPLYFGVVIPQFQCSDVFKLTENSEIQSVFVQRKPFSMIRTGYQPATLAYCVRKLIDVG